jgi:putative membrane protein
MGQAVTTSRQAAGRSGARARRRRRGALHRPVGVAIATAALALARAAQAHDGAAPTDAWWTMWAAPAAVAVPLAALGLLYLVGALRMRRRAGALARARNARALAFAGGWLALALALLSPLHPLGELLFSAHMAQHELLMVIAAPLLVLGRPAVVALWALPRRVRHGLGSVARRSAIQRTWRTATRPLVAWGIHTLVLWTWHLPVLFEATLDSELVHAAQHLSFLGSALLFWSAIIDRPETIRSGVAVLYVFVISIETALLGALLTFARTVWYPAYTATAPQWGLTPLADQQLGGLIMWIPGGALYVVAGLLLGVRWLRAAQRETARAWMWAPPPVRIGAAR